MTPLHIVLAIVVAFIWGVNFTFIAWALESFACGLWTLGALARTKYRL